jgi:outer membrane protein assembly factor BamA
VDYTNRQHRWNWAVAGEIMPFATGLIAFAEDNGAFITVTEVLERQISRGFIGIASYPLNSTMRLELGGAARQLTFQHENRVSVFDSNTGEMLDRRRDVTQIGPPMYLAEPLVALVRDTTLHGAISPLYGDRMRFEVDQSFGDLTYSSLLIDYRKYFMPKRPITVAVRGVHFGRYGPDAEHPLLVDLYAGYPELVHGYYLGSITAADCANPAGGGDTCLVYNNLRGSRLFVANLEVRAPLFGLIKGEMSYGKVPIEIGGFFDAGVTWSTGDRPALAGGNRPLMRSAGVAVRGNVFGFLLVEVSAAHPFDRPGVGIQWQFGIRSGF